MHRAAARVPDAQPAASQTAQKLASGSGGVQVCIILSVLIRLYQGA
jgi:hypothetical protein